MLPKYQKTDRLVNAQINGKTKFSLIFVKISYLNLTD